MSTNIRTDFSPTLATTFLDNIYYKRANFYYFLGKISPWSGGDDDVPASIELTSEQDSIIRDNIAYIRRVNPGEISLITKNYKWESGVVYDQWDHTLVMNDKKFYCVTNEFNVYKCLNNNGGAESTIEPSGNSLSTFSTADGYVWKYMYNIPQFKRRKFLNTKFIPVQKALSDGFYNKGAVEQVSIVDGGSGYTTSPQVTLNITGDGADAQLLPVISSIDGSIIEVKIINPGTGYTTANITVDATSGTGIYGNATAIITPIVYNGSIVNVTIEDPGQNYPADTTTTIIVQGDGVGAVFIPIVSGGTIIDVVVDDPGVGYSFINLIVDGSGTDANLQAVIAASDFLSDQAMVEQSAEDGAIYTIVVDNPGNNYTENSTITIEGDGAGAEAELILDDGTISKINVTNTGYGYTYANVIINDDNRLIPNDYIDAVVHAVLPPVGGHGFNAPKELYADSICIFTQLVDNDELLLINQDYRQYGLLVNPTLLSNFRRAVDNIYFITLKVTLNNIVNVNVDDLLLSNNVYYRVVNIVGNQLEIQQLSRIYKNVEVDDIFYKVESYEIQYTVVTIDEEPAVDKYSGDLIYVTNAEPFTPTEEQLVAIRTYITF